MIILYQIFSNLSIPFLCFFMFFELAPHDRLSYRFNGCGYRFRPTNSLLYLYYSIDFLFCQHFILFFYVFVKGNFRRVRRGIWTLGKHWTVHLHPHPLDNYIVSHFCESVKGNFEKFWKFFGYVLHALIILSTKATFSHRPLTLIIILIFIRKSIPFYVFISKQSR